MAGRTRVKVAWKRGAFAELRTLPAVMAVVNDMRATFGLEPVAA